MSAEQAEALGRFHAARRLWTLRRSPLQALGGPMSPIMLIGHPCRLCSDAVDHVGSLGPSSLERSLVSHLCPDLIPKLGWDQLRMTGLRGWAVDAFEDPSVQASSRLWEHLSDDLIKISAQLRAALGG